MGHATYFAIDLASVFVPFVASFHSRLRFDRRWFAFWPACVLSSVVFIAWDMLYTHWGIWGFNDRYLLGPRVGNLPIEEVMFFICIPFASIFSYHCFEVLRAPKLTWRWTQRIAYGLSIVLLAVGLIFLPRLYTSVTFLLSSGFIFILVRSKAAYLGSFFWCFLFVLIPFFIVNGLLTGSYLDEPVVWYNNAHNLGIRLATIPVEDVFYGMLLLLLNTSLYEFFAQRAVRNGRHERVTG